MGCSCVKHVDTVRALDAYRADGPTTPHPHQVPSDPGERPVTASESHSSVAWSPGKVVEASGAGFQDGSGIPHTRVVEPRASDAGSAPGELLEAPLPKPTPPQESLTGDGGVKKTIVIEGQGSDMPPSGSIVTLDYVGLLEDGTQFESTRDFGEPLRFCIGSTEVVPGLEIGVMHMKKGEQAVLLCSPDYAYGLAGVAGKVPGGATIMLVVDLRSWYVPASPLEGGTAPEPRPRDKVTPPSRVPPSVSQQSADEGVALTSDAGVRKSVVQAGRGPVIPEGAIPIVHYVALLENGIELESTYDGGGGPVRITEETSTSVPKGVAIAACTMRKDEQVLLRCSSAYTYLTMFRDVPVMLFVVDLVSWEEPAGVPPVGSPTENSAAPAEVAEGGGDARPLDAEVAQHDRSAAYEKEGGAEEELVCADDLDMRNGQAGEGEVPEPEPEPTPPPVAVQKELPPPPPQQKPPQPQQQPGQEDQEDTFGTSCSEAALHARVQKASASRGPAEGAEDEAAMDSDDEFAHSMLKSAALNSLANMVDDGGTSQGEHTADGESGEVPDACEAAAGATRKAVPPPAEGEPASPIEIPVAAPVSTEDGELSPLSEADIVRRIAGSLDSSLHKDETMDDLHSAATPHKTRAHP